MKKLKHDRPEKERFAKVAILPTKTFIWEYKKYSAGETIVLPTISVNKEIHKIIKEL